MKLTLTWNQIDGLACGQYFDTLDQAMAKIRAISAFGYASSWKLLLAGVVILRS